MGILNTKHNISGTEKDKIKNQLARYISRELDDVVAAYLFGSFIGKKQFSDIDLGLLLKSKALEVLRFELSIETQLERLFEHSFDVRVLNHAPNSFTQNVIRTGKVIVDKDPNLRTGFEGNILKQYFDFAYFRRRYLKEVGSAAI